MREPRWEGIKQARVAFGDAAVDDMLARPAGNQRCDRCNLHQGFMCVCEPDEKRAHAVATGKMGATEGLGERLR